MKENEIKSEVEVLNDLTKGIKMGMDAISNVVESVKDNEFKQILLSQYNKYNDLLNQVDKKLQDFDKIPKDLPTMQKTIGYIGVKLNTSSDNSTSHICEMIMQGINMGITKGITLLHNCPNISKESKDILNEFINYQESCIETLKKYL